MAKVNIDCPDNYLDKLVGFLVAIKGAFFTVDNSEAAEMSGSELKEIRELLGMTQERFSDEVASTSQVAICRMELGKMKISKTVAEAAVAAKEQKLAKRK